MDRTVTDIHLWFDPCCVSYYATMHNKLKLGD